LGGGSSMRAAPEGDGGGDEGGAGVRVCGRRGAMVARVDGWMVFICTTDHLNRPFKALNIKNDFK
jgi:hypothetical protein